MTKAQASPAALPTLSRSAVSARLSKTSSGTILFDGQLLGRYVRYGGKAKKPGQLPPTLYGSRVYCGALRIEEEATTVPALMKKVASALWAAYADGTWQPRAMTQELLPEGEHQGQVPLR